MVGRQLAGRGIRDCRVLAAMAWVPREWFLPPHLAGSAYEDAPLPIGSAQPISQPLIVPLMTDAPPPPRPPRSLRRSHFPAGVYGGALEMKMKRALQDLLGAHVSTQGGVAEAPARGVAIGATAIQVFTKTPNQWREPTVREADAAAFRSALAASGSRPVVSPASYLLHQPTPNEALRAKSVRAFTGELERCRALGIPWVVSHPGNYIDDRADGLTRNARAYAECLAAVPEVGLLIEGTAGAGTALGSTFEELRARRDARPDRERTRVGVCLG